MNGMSRQVEGKIARRLVHQVNPAQVILCAELVATLPAYSVKCQACGHASHGAEVCVARVFAECPVCLCDDDSRDGS